MMRNEVRMSNIFELYGLYLTKAVSYLAKKAKHAVEGMGKKVEQ